MNGARRRFGVTAIESIFFQGFGMCLSLCWVFLISRALTVADAGHVFVAMSVTNSIIAIFSLGLPQSFAVQSRRMDSRALASNALCATIAMGTLAAVCALVVEKTTLPYMDRSFNGYSIIAAIALSLFLSTMCVSILRATFAFRLANIGSMIALSLFNAQLIWALVGHLPLTAHSVMFKYLLSVATASIALLAVLLWKFGFSSKSVKKSELRALFSFGGGVHIGNVFKEAMYRADLYVVGWFLGPAAAGLYGVVLRVVEVIARFVDALGLVIVPLIAHGDERERRDISYLSMSVVVPVMLVMALVTSIFAEEMILALFGAPYLPSSAVLRIGIWSLVPLTIWKILANDLIGRARLGIYIASTVVGAALIAGLNMVLLPQFGVIAAAYVLNIAYLVPALMLLYFVVAKLGYRPLSLFLFSSGPSRT